MHFKQKMTYMAFGCLPTLAGYILASVSNDSVVQSGAEDVTFGTMNCRKLRVVDDEGDMRVLLSNDEYGGFVLVSGKDGGQAKLGNNKHGGSVVVFGDDDGHSPIVYWYTHWFK